MSREGRGGASISHTQTLLSFLASWSFNITEPRKSDGEKSSLKGHLREVVAYKSVDHIGPEFFSFVAYYGDFRLMLAMLYSRGKVNFEKQSVTIY